MLRTEKAKGYLRQRGVDYQSTEALFMQLTYDRLKGIYRDKFPGRKLPKTKSAIVDMLVVDIHKGSLTKRQLRRMEATAA